MPVNSVPIEGFVKALHDWVNSVHLDRQDRAKSDSEKLKIYARLLADDREFQILYGRNLDSCATRDPQQAMNCVYAFLNTVAEASRPGNFHAFGF